MNENFGPFKLLAKNEILNQRSAKINHRIFVLTNQKFGQTFMWTCSKSSQYHQNQTIQEKISTSQLVSDRTNVEKNHSFVAAVTCTHVLSRR